MAKGTSQRISFRAVLLACIVLIGGFGMVTVSLFRWQVVHGEELTAQALEQSLQSTTISAMRGTIYDATGTKILAQSASVWTVVLEPNYIREDEELRRTISRGLAPILEMDEERIYEKTGEDSYFSYLKRQVETDVRDAINQFLTENEIESGVRLIPDYKRYYPYGTVASNVLGFTGYDNTGLDGLELYYDEELRGTAGRLVASKNAWGTDMPFEYEQYVGASDGNSLVLTIDETVQSILEKYLAEGIEKYKVKNGAVAIVMNVHTGAVVGLATHPNYDPNDPYTILDANMLQELQSLPEDQRDEAETNAWYKQWRNKAVSDTYYPGSVFKMVTGAMGLEEGVVTLESTFTCTGNKEVEGYPAGIDCWKEEGHGLEDFAAGIYNSCNPWMIHLGELLGAETFCKYREAFGMTEPTGIDLPGEAVNLYHSLEDMGPTELATEAFGQNFSITPVQMITAASAIANGGYMVQPHVVDRIVDPEGNIVKTTDTTPLRQVISQETAQTITSILQYNAAEGTATGGYVPGYRVCGKTGTSEKIAQHNEDPTKPMEYIASYCGYAPAEDPQYALLVYFDEPDGASNGGLTGGNAVAGPIFSKIMGEILPYLGVEARYTDEEFGNLDVAAPSVVGLTLDEAIAAIEESGLEYSVIGSEEGSTLVREQTPEVGTTLPKDGSVVLYTEGFSQEEAVTPVPDFSGMDLVNASYLAAINGLQISVSGSSSGLVSTQNIAVGQNVRIGTVIALTFVDNIETDTFVSLE